MTTAVVPDTTSVEDLDFSICCEVSTCTTKGGRIIRQSSDSCKRPAKFSGRYPCCGHVTLACKEHVTDGNEWLCARCHREYCSHKMNWTPL